jgi:YidC/Oxa1 family membrane protein insertase
MGELWNVAFFQPMLNGLILLYHLLFQNFGVTIILFTILIRLVLLPLTLRQLRSTKAMTAIQSRLLELQKKYARDKKRLAEEQMKLYKEAGINPTGCIWPMLLQIPIWIALYQAILKGLAASPEELQSLSAYLYSSSLIQGIVPLRGEFLWLNLAQPDTTLVLPVLVGVSMWVQQKMITTTTTTDPRQQSMNNLMLWMMPMMFALFTFQFASGLAIYWTASNIIGIVIQYSVTGWGGLRRPATPPAGKKVADGTAGIPRQDSGRSDRDRPGETGAKERRGGGNRPFKGTPGASGDRDTGGPGAGESPPRP